MQKEKLDCCYYSIASENCLNFSINNVASNTKCPCPSKYHLLVPRILHLDSSDSKQSIGSIILKEKIGGNKTADINRLVSSKSKRCKNRACLGSGKRKEADEHLENPIKWEICTTLHSSTNALMTQPKIYVANNWCDHNYELEEEQNVFCNNRISDTDSMDDVEDAALREAMKNGKTLARTNEFFSLLSQTEMLQPINIMLANDSLHLDRTEGNEISMASMEYAASNEDDKTGKKEENLKRIQKEVQNDITQLRTANNVELQSNESKNPIKAFEADCRLEETFDMVTNMETVIDTIDHKKKSTLVKGSTKWSETFIDDLSETNDSQIGFQAHEYASQKQITTIENQSHSAGIEKDVNGDMKNEYVRKENRQKDFRLQRKKINDLSYYLHSLSSEEDDKEMNRTSVSSRLFNIPNESMMSLVSFTYSSNLENGNNNIQNMVQYPNNSLKAKIKRKLSTRKHQRNSNKDIR